MGNRETAATAPCVEEREPAPGCRGKGRGGAVAGVLEDWIDYDYDYEHDARGTRRRTEGDVG